MGIHTRNVYLGNTLYGYTCTWNKENIWVYTKFLIVDYIHKSPGKESKQRQGQNNNTYPIAEHRHRGNMVSHKIIGVVHAERMVMKQHFLGIVVVTKHCPLEGSPRHTRQGFPQ